MKNLLIGAGLVGLGLLGAVALDGVGDAAAATQTKSIQYDDTTVVITHGDFRRISDGGTLWNVCAEVRKLDGGVVAVETPCISCEGNPNSTTLNTCKQTWRDTNGF
jgi:hypothetical protein